MPAKLEVDREAVRTLVVAVGVREAARQMSLPEDTVCSWAHRYKWIQRKKEAQALAKARIATNPLQANASKPADALVNTLEEHSKKTRLGLSIAARKAAETLQNMPGKAILVRSKALKEITGAAASLHGWNEKGDSGVHLNIALIMGAAE